MSDSTHWTHSESFCGATLVCSRDVLFILAAAGWLHPVKRPGKKWRWWLWSY